MIDVEPMIIDELDRLVPGPGSVGADWRDVERRAGRPTPRRRFVLAGAFALAVVFVAVAIARSLGGFDDWISGQPGKPASKVEQSAFDKATRSWVGFPANTQLRRLAQTRIGGATYTLDGFSRGGDALSATCREWLAIGA